MLTTVLMPIASYRLSADCSCCMKVLLLYIQNPLAYVTAKLYYLSLPLGLWASIWTTTSVVFPCKVW